MEALPGRRARRATTGLGFAAVEGCEYALAAALSAEGVDLRALLETELLRGPLTPSGHGLWTAVAGAALLSRRRPDGGFRLTGPVVGACAGAALLHVLWDATHGVALWLVARLAGPGLDRRLFAQGSLPWPSAAQQHLFALLSLGGLVLVTVCGAVRIRSLTHRDPPWRNTP